MMKNMVKINIIVHIVVQVNANMGLIETLVQNALKIDVYMVIKKGLIEGKTIVDDEEIS
jgi:hypothetical protein